MASEVELERLVVRLIGDAQSYRKMLQDAEQETQQAMGNIVGIVAQGAAALGGAQFLKGTFASFSEGEHVTLQLRAALEANQREVESTIADYEEFALTMQRATTFSDEHIKTLLKVSETYGFTGDQAKQMTQQSMALAAATGGEAQSMMRLVAAVTRGNEEDLAHLEMYKRMIPQLRMAHSQEEQLEVIRRLTATGTKLLAAETETATGKLKQLNEEWDNAKEQLGAVVADGLKPVLTATKEIVVWFQNTDPAVKTLVVTVVGLTTAVAGLMAGFRTLQIVGITAGMSLRGIGYTAIAAGLVAITSKVIQGTQAFKDYQEELGKIRSTGAGAITGGAEARKQKVMGIDDAGERKAALEKEAEMADALVKVYQEGFEKAKIERDDLFKEKPGDVTGNIGKLFGEYVAAPLGINARMDVLDEGLKAANDRLNVAKNAAHNVRQELEQMNKVAGGELVGKAKEDLAKFTKELEQQSRTFGMTSNEAKLYALQVQYGLTPAHMEEAQAWIDLHAALEQGAKDYEAAQEAAKKLQEETANVAKSLEREIDVLLLGADAAKLKELAEQGVDEAMLGHIAGLQEEKKWLDENNKMRQEADQALAKFAESDPTAKYEQGLARINEMVRREIINEDEYLVMLSQLNDEWDEAADAAGNAAGEVGRFDAALSGSAEAGRRVSDFYGKLADQYAKAVPKKKGLFAGVKEFEFIGGEGLEAQPGIEQVMDFPLHPGARQTNISGPWGIQRGDVWEQVESPLQLIMVDEEKKQVKVLEDILKAVRENGQQIVFEAADFE